MAEPVRLDRALVDAGLARSRNQAQQLVREGKVTVDGRTVTRPSSAVQPGQQVALTEEAPRWVGRGALKLEGALSLWPDLVVAGRRCIDVGASTGGFTQVLLERGAAHVTALDVGHDQLVPELREEPRVRDLPGTNVRDVTAEELGGPFDLLVCDLSFISLVTVLPHLAGLVAPGGDLVLLVKPQFEVGPAHVGKGGIVRSPAARGSALRAVVDTATGLGLTVRGLARSPVTGTHGNTEYLVWLSAGPAGMMGTPDPAARISELIAEED